jgi:hypothetical protein
MNFAAVQILGSEKPHHAIQAFFDAAESSGLKFKMLKPFEIMSLGSSRLVRFQTDCNQLSTLADTLIDSGRGYVYPLKGEFLYKTKVKVGKLPTLRMTTTATFNSNAYVGTMGEFWRRQFSDR